MILLTADRVLDCSGLFDPLPIVKTSKAMKEIQIGQVLEVVATYPAAPADLPAWSRMTGNELLDAHQDGAKFVFFIRRVQ